jgi:hypothetical protein
MDDMIIHQPMPLMSYPHIMVMTPYPFTTQDLTPCGAYTVSGATRTGRTQGVRLLLTDSSQEVPDHAGRCSAQGASWVPTAVGCGRGWQGDLASAIHSACYGSVARVGRYANLHKKRALLHSYRWSPDITTRSTGGRARSRYLRRAGWSVDTPRLAGRDRRSCEVAVTPRPCGVTST